MNNLRLAGPDLIRTIAIFCVIAGHFIAVNTPYQSSIFDGSISMWLQSACMPFFAIGVPLFIMLTGFLNANKNNPNKQYYKNITKVLIPYLVISILTILFRRFYLGEQLSIWQWTQKILDFSAIPYAWYVEMWIGLFLLTPFLNKLWDTISSQKEKKTLLWILFILTALPDFFNRYGIYIAPAFWKMAFPLFFFFSGRYVKDFKNNHTNNYYLWLFVILCFLNPLVSTIVPGEHSTIQIVGGPYGIVSGPIAILLFGRLVWIKNGNPLIKAVASCSLEMYLCCYAIDQIVYPFFLNNYYTNQAQFGAWFFIIIPSVFILTFLISSIIHKVLFLFKLR